MKKSTAFWGTDIEKSGKCEMIYIALTIPQSKLSDAPSIIFAALAPIATLFVACAAPAIIAVADAL